MGIVAPQWEQWRRFTFDTSSPYETILINCLNVPDYPKSVGYLRAVFITPDFIYSPWLKFFPKVEKEMYTLPIPPEILANPDAVPRGFEIMKLPKRRPTYNQVIEDEWSVSLEVLSKTGLPTGGSNPPGSEVLIGDDSPLTPGGVMDLLLGFE